MENNIFASLSNLSNFINVAVTLWLVSYNCRKCFILPLEKKDHVFYLLKLKKSFLFLVINILYLYGDYRVYEQLHFDYPPDLIFIRYLARILVTFYLGFKILDCVRYYPTNYDKIKE